MKKSSTIQYLPLTRPLASYAISKKLLLNDRNVILDLEDSAQDIFNDETNLVLKKNAREGLKEISKFKIPTNNSKLYVRINSSETSFYKHDLDVIKECLKNGFPITGLFLPMVNNYDQIENVSKIFGDKLEIVPMIETVEGMNNLEKILTNDSKNIIKRVHYGNFDYSYSAKFWPFLDPNHDKYWNVINYIVKILKKHNKSFVGSPFPFPYKEEMFWQCAFKTEEISDLDEIWHCCVNSSLALSERPKTCSELTIIKYQFSNDNKIVIANNIIKDFLEGRSNKRSFGVSDHRFIAPHQYLAAKLILNTHE
ncbi:aldolase/citrate lyase family protein [Flavobacteriaceae bacterium]|nr:aldolase/citrate lyase family protein [Flavobacteriaceae bacterium]MDC3221257.1 aldolase/citrate lyase family protein [Flavobacteriaceae bacterium]